MLRSALDVGRNSDFTKALKPAVRSSGAAQQSTGHGSFAVTESFGINFRMAWLEAVAILSLPTSSVDLQRLHIVDA